jgi:uncharacterized protein (TIGR03000 family)
VYVQGSAMPMQQGGMMAPANPPQTAPAPGGGSAPPAAQPPAGGGATKPTGTMQEARVNVKMPANAKLYVDGQLTSTSSQAVRSFKTPALPVGQDFYYTMRMEVERGGQTISDTKQVIVRAGATVEASFDLPTGGAVAAK